MLSKFTIKRRLHKSKYREFTTRCKQFLNFKITKAILDYAKDIVGSQTGS